MAAAACGMPRCVLGVSRDFLFHARNTESAAALLGRSERAMCSVGEYKASSGFSESEEQADDVTTSDSANQRNLCIY